MTLLDFVKQKVEVYNQDEHRYYYVTGDNPELFLKNLCDGWAKDELEHYTKTDFATVEEALEDDPGNFMQALVYAAWLTKNGTTYNDCPEDLQYVDECFYAIEIGTDYINNAYEIDIDLI